MAFDRRTPAERKLDALTGKIDALMPHFRKMHDKQYVERAQALEMLDLFRLTAAALEELHRLHRNGSSNATYFGLSQAQWFRVMLVFAGSLGFSASFDAFREALTSFLLP